MWTDRTGQVFYLGEGLSGALHVRLVNDLFPGYLLSQDSRHPKYVVVCSECGCLNEYAEAPSKNAPIPCAECNGPVYTERPTRRQRVPCRRCGNRVPVPHKGLRPSARPPYVGYGVSLQGVQTDSQRTVLQTP